MPALPGPFSAEYRFGVVDCESARKAAFFSAADGSMTAKLREDLRAGFVTGLVTRKSGPARTSGAAEFGCRC